MNTRVPLVLAGALAATCAFGQLVATGINTGVKTLFYAAVVDQDLLITVDNTTLGASGQTGSVTSFGFNTPWTAPLNLSKVAISYQVSSLTGPTEPWNPLSEFELTAGLGGGGVTVDLGLESDDNGNPNGNDVKNGVEFGEIVQFKFSFDATTYDIPDLEYVADFFNQNPDGPDFLVRWQNVLGSTAGTSDAFAGDFPNDTDVPQGPVPEPSTYGLIGAAALLGLVSYRRFRRSTPRA
ncbi:MAG TPA: PEP-CTERM sorting domain-containing protein [Opitutaceae bacterium]|nr:PEP-CTERM sorting domain-containing protein [Opitutaceae bacterium]